MNNENIHKRSKILQQGVSWSVGWRNNRVHTFLYLTYSKLFIEGMRISSFSSKISYILGKRHNARVQGRWLMKVKGNYKLKHEIKISSSLNYFSYHTTCPSKKLVQYDSL